jgi:cytochrome c oxidase subunit IV
VNLRGPLIVYGANLLLLGAILLLAFFAPRGVRPYAIPALALVQAALILLIGMELRRDAPLIRLFAGIGGFWLTILLTLSLFDYLTR